MLHAESRTVSNASSAGLTTAEAECRLGEFGPNDPAPKKQRSHLVELLLQFANPLVAILIFASLVSIFVGEIANVSIIIVIVSLSVALNFVQTFRSQQAAERLRAAVAPSATVLRDGAFSDIPRVNVVPGDVVRVCAGNLVPADARLLTSKDLHVQEVSRDANARAVRDPDAKKSGLQSASLPLALTTVLIVIVGTVLPYSPLARVLGFEPLPAAYFLFLSGATLTYLVLVQLAKHVVLYSHRLRGSHP